MSEDGADGAGNRAAPLQFWEGAILPSCGIACRIATGGWAMAEQKNVLGGDLMACCFAPLTGFYRDGACRTGPQDTGTHVVCVKVDAGFLAFSQARGNDLTTPVPEFAFPGLKPGDKWCLCALRWQEALEAGVAPQVLLQSTHARALDFIDLEDLKGHAHDLR
jgi:uncharacterized protein (DUF2237 family)